MTRDEAWRRVEAVAVRLDGYSAVALDDVLTLLGACEYEALLGDPIRGRGPAEGYLYAWNVVDVLCGCRLVEQLEQQGLTKQQTKAVAQVMGFYAALQEGRRFTADQRVRFLAIVTAWPIEKAATFCGTKLKDAEARSDDGLRALSFMLVAGSGHCGPHSEAETLAHLAGWSTEYAEHAIELATQAGVIRDLPRCQSDDET